MFDFIPAPSGITLSLITALLGYASGRLQERKKQTRLQVAAARRLHRVIGDEYYKMKDVESSCSSGLVDLPEAILSFHKESLERLDPSIADMLDIAGHGPAHEMEGFWREYKRIPYTFEDLDIEEDFGAVISWSNGEPNHRLFAGKLTAMRNVLAHIKHASSGYLNKNI